VLKKKCQDLCSKASIISIVIDFGPQNRFSSSLMGNRDGYVETPKN